MQNRLNLIWLEYGVMFNTIQCNVMQFQVMEMAMRVGAPVIGLNDSGGARYRAYMHVYIVKIGIQL